MVRDTIKPSSTAAQATCLDEQLLALNEALDRFTALEPKQAELIKLRYFVGMKIGEAAGILGISEATAKRWWAYARAWLFNAINTPE